MCEGAIKLDMDLVADARLRGDMAEPDPPSPHDDLIRQLFYLLTARFEDGAAAAAEGQADGLQPDAQIALANRLHAVAHEAITLADAVVALRLSSRPAGRSN